MIKKIEVLVFALLGNLAIAQWDITSVPTEVSTNDEIVGPVLRISNEIRVADTFVASDPTFGTLDNSGYGINLHKTEGVGFAFAGSHRVVFKPNGDTGIGTDFPLGRLHVSTGTSGDAILRLEADTDNNNESDNPLLQLRQDGGQTGINIGFSEGNFGANIFGIGTRYSGQDSWESFTIDTSNGNVGIGTNNVDSKLRVEGRTRVGMNGTLHLDWTHEDNWGGNSSKWAGYIGFNANRNNNDPKDEYYGSNTYTNKGVIEGSNYGFRWLYRNRSGNDSSGQHLLTEYMRLTNDGELGIGTSSPDSKLTVKGDIHAEEVKVDLSVPGPDYVFKDGYDLISLEEVQDHIQEHGHLPNIPSAKEMEDKGIELGIMNMKLLEKIEELTLYILLQEERIQKIETELKLK